MRISLPVAVLAASAAFAACSTEPTPAWRMGDPAVGYQVARDLCADCHAIGRIGDSRDPAAPPLRTVLGNYPPEWLSADLHNGQPVGFRRMPVFHFGEGHEYDLVAYLQDIQEIAPPQPNLGPAIPR